MRLSRAETSSPTRIFLFALLTSIFFLTPGCLGGDFSPIGGPGGSDNAGAADSCEGPLGPPRDPATLTACCQEMAGEAHCLDEADVPAEIGAYLGKCAGGGYCVPDVAIRTGGVWEPPACASVGGEAGVCLSVCVPQVQEYITLLPQDTCAADERCVPCISPLDNMPTGACELRGECVGAGGGSGGGGTTESCDDPATCVREASCGPAIDTSTLTPCAEDAHCLDRSLVPADVQDQLGPCPDATKLCVPDTFLESGGKFIAPTCRSLANAEGRCLSRAIPEVRAQEDLLPQATCAATERCVPCYSPLDGTDTGACALSCDPGPAEGPTTLPACCDGRATCVPQAAVDAGMSENLEEDTCEDVQAGAYWCVPNELLNPAYTPPACSANSILIGQYTGVCLSDCLDFGIQGLALSRGSCASGYKCTPCTDPLSGDPTGAPGCP